VQAVATLPTGTQSRPKKKKNTKNNKFKNNGNNANRIPLFGTMFILPNYAVMRVLFALNSRAFIFPSRSTNAF
jgi:hypothetical protein